MDTEPHKNGDQSGGRGEERTDSYLSPVQENKIVSMMLNPRRRWRVTPKAKRLALKITLRNIEKGDERESNAAVANLIKMEAQNQVDDAKGIEPGGTVINNTQININGDVVPADVYERINYYRAKLGAVKPPGPGSDPVRNGHGKPLGSPKARKEPPPA